MADDLSAVLAEIREALDSADAGRWYEAGRRMSRALDEVLKPHAPRADVLYGRSCITHRPLKPVPGCVLCTQDQRREVCPECRDEFGDLVPFGDCRARKAALSALTGEAETSG